MDPVTCSLVGHLQRRHEAQLAFRAWRAGVERKKITAYFLKSHKEIVRWELERHVSEYSAVRYTLTRLEDEAARAICSRVSCDIFFAIRDVLDYFEETAARKRAILRKVALLYLWMDRRPS